MQKYYAQNADKGIRLWLEKKGHCALKMMASAPLASGSLRVANTNKIANTNTNTNKIGRYIEVYKVYKI